MLVNFLSLLIKIFKKYCFFLLGAAGIFVVSLSHGEIVMDSTFYIPTNGDICRRCDRVSSPNIYFAELEDFFYDPDAKNYTKQTLTDSVEQLIAEELSQIIVHIGSANSDMEPDISKILENKIEGLKVLAGVLNLHFGSWASDLVNDSFYNKMKACNFDQEGNACSYLNYENGECETCKDISIEEALDLLNDKQTVSRLKSALSSASVLSSKFGQLACKENAETNSSSLNTDPYCGILKSQKIRDAFSLYGSTAYVGFLDNSYSCQKVGLFIKRNPVTNKIEPDSERSFLVSPTGQRHDLTDEEVKEIIKQIFSSVRNP